MVIVTVVHRLGRLGGGRESGAEWSCLVVPPPDEQAAPNARHEQAEHRDARLFHVSRAYLVSH